MQNNTRTGTGRLKMQEKWQIKETNRESKIADRLNGLPKKTAAFPAPSKWREAI